MYISVLGFLKQEGTGLDERLGRPLDVIIQEVEEDDQAIMKWTSSYEEGILPTLQEAGRDAAVEFYRRQTVMGEWEAAKWLKSRVNE